LQIEFFEPFTKFAWLSACMKITFVGPLVSRFVRNDVTILSRKHQLKTIDAKVGRGFTALINLTRLELRIVASLLTSDCLFFWFADYYSLIPTLIARLLRKPIYVVAGGFDVWYLPELKIGARNKPIRWFLVKNTFKFVTHIFPVSEHAQNMLFEGVPGHAPSTVIYNTVDTNYFTWHGQQKKAIALTVTQVDTRPEYIRKGIDLFIAAAARLQSTTFQIVGIRGFAEIQAREDSKHCTNVEIIPAPIASEDLKKCYEEASVYCQLSIDETFGVAVVEGMSAGCIPVVSQSPALNEVVGGEGHIVERESLDNIVTAISQSLNAEAAERAHCQERAKLFDFEARAKVLLSFVR
jgi:glycosyltransferase involved in cell wall biosynthesis